MKFKHVLKQLFSRIHVKIRSGPLKGKKWIAVSGSAFISGNYEQYKTESFLKHFRHGSVFFDIGAHIGYYTSLAALINNGTGSVVAFEPRPMNIRFFKDHMRLNSFKNITLIEAAAGDRDCDVWFDDKTGSASGFVSESGNIRVRQVWLDRMVKDREVPIPDFIKIDVEGGEISVLKGLENVITTARPGLIIAIHRQECREFTENFLSRHNYTFEVLNPQAVAGDTEIIALPVY